MKKILVAFFLLFNQAIFSQEFTRCDSLRGNLYSERSCYDVFYYDLDINVFYETKFIYGSNTIYFTALEDFNIIQIDLFENMNIDFIVFEGEQLLFYRDCNAVFIEFNREIKKNEKGKIQVQYRGNPKIAKNPPWDGGFSWEEDVNENIWIGVSCQGLGASSWWPCKDHQSDEPDSMRIACSIPYEKGDINVVSNGNLRSRYIIKGLGLRDDMKFYEWFVSYPINNYNVTLNIGDYTHFTDIHIRNKDTLNLDYYVLSYNEDVAKKWFKNVKPMLQCFESFLGPYPFKEDGFALVETPYLGMEHQSAIAYGNKYLKGYLGNQDFIAGLDFDYIIVHEAGHEWWGNSITTNDIADMWVQEGFCTYSEALYVECIYGYDAMINYILNQKKMIRNDSPIIGSYSVNNEGSTDMYQKSSVMLHTLRTLLSDDKLWIDILKGLQKEFQYKTIDGRDVIEYINIRSAYDLTAFFEQYLENKELPVFEYYIQKKKKKYYLNFRWNAINKFDMPILATVNINNTSDLISEDNIAYSWIYPSRYWKRLELKGVTSSNFKIAEHLFLLEVEKIK